ncbi:hypothetical protein [Komagataeibacter sp. FNDCR2]|uniref:hypothetical protein n=1 Tax=Komagataeibacter sp. FNDCR2 TaxID=2878682 RepID=UPI001E3615B8|nr:hypothetical protein [Komagataeibacter sp. FNDCR2]MCE2576049.1 hypothetical protein [Komagataeibacter sp. FNDCR2]
MINRKSALALFFVSALPVTPSHADSLPDEYMKVAVSGGRRPVIDIATNLPENMQVSVDVNPVGGGFDDGGTYTVHNGHVHVGPLSNSGYDAPAGTYNLLITSPVTQFQADPKVQDLLGDEGQNLHGPDAKESEVGMGKVIDIRSSFTIN